MTINVVCRKDAINRNHLAPLALVFTHDRRRKFLGLGISVALEHWDFDKQQPAKNCPDGAEIQFQITSKMREYEKKIKKLEVLEIPVTFDNVFEQNGKRINCTVGDYFKQIIERLEKVEKYGSASKHKVTLALMQQFKSTNMRFEELDLTYLREFEIFLRQRGNVNNSLATKFSVLKAVYNTEQAQEIIDKYHTDQVEEDYLFPILDRQIHKTEKQILERVKKTLSRPDLDNRSKRSNRSE